jgi:hypothetical protein
MPLCLRVRACLVSYPRVSVASEMDQTEPLTGSAGFGDLQQFGAVTQSAEQSSSASGFDENSLITDAASLLDPDFIAQLGAELGFTDGFANASQSHVPAITVQEHQPKIAPVKSDSEGAKRRRLRQFQLDAALERFQTAASSNSAARPLMQSERNETKSAGGRGAGEASAPLAGRRRDGESSDASSDGERDPASAKFREVCCQRH